MTTDELAQAFERHRPHLQRVAYAVLGSIGEAEDVVQDAWLRLQRQQDWGQIRDLRAWLTTTVGRLALDALGSARARREQYVGPWLPEPVVERPRADWRLAGAAAPDPADSVTLDESVSLALMIVLERLSPAERTAFLLHDVFGLTFAEVGEVVGRSPQTARKLAERARRDAEDGRPRFPSTRSQQLELVTAFSAACSEGDIQGLIELLDPEVVLRTDGGGKVTAARTVHAGAQRVAKILLALGRRPLRTVYLADVNGMPGLVLDEADGTLNVVSLTVDAGQIVAIDIIRNPDKLRAVPLP